MSMFLTLLHPYLVSSLSSSMYLRAELEFQKREPTMPRLLAYRATLDTSEERQSVRKCRGQKGSLGTSANSSRT